MNPVLIIAAVSAETELLAQSLKHGATIDSPGFTVVTGRLGSLPVAVCSSGIGKINASAATATLIERYQPRLVINLGCAGAYAGSNLKIGDLAVADIEILADEGVELSRGWLGLDKMGLPSLATAYGDYYNEIPMSYAMTEKVMKFAVHLEVEVMRGRFATVSTCSGSTDRGDTVERRFNVIAESMEGAAVALVCLRYGVDCIEIRGISNMVGERDIASWDIPRATTNAQRFVVAFLEDNVEAD